MNGHDDDTTLMWVRVYEEDGQAIMRFRHERLTTQAAVRMLRHLADMIETGAGLEWEWDE